MLTKKVRINFVEDWPIIERKYNILKINADWNILKNLIINKKKRDYILKLIAILFAIKTKDKFLIDKKDGTLYLPSIHNVITNGLRFEDLDAGFAPLRQTRRLSPKEIERIDRKIRNTIRKEIYKLGSNNTRGELMMLAAGRTETWIGERDFDIAIGGGFFFVQGNNKLVAQIRTWYKSYRFDVYIPVKVAPAIKYSHLHIEDAIKYLIKNLEIAGG